MTSDVPIDDAAALTRYIETRYHARHRQQLPTLFKMAEMIEDLHVDDRHVPEGLSGLLGRMIGEMEVHMKKEELILFPAVRKAASGLDAPIAAMRQGHGDHAADIAQIGQLTNGLTLPPDACPIWTRLYAELGEFVAELEEHIRLENEVLFPRVETRSGRNV